MPNSTHEAEFVEAFVVADKRSRYLEFLPNRKRRGEISGADILNATARKLRVRGECLFRGLYRIANAENLARIDGLTNSL